MFFTTFARCCTITVKICGAQEFYRYKRGRFKLSGYSIIYNDENSMRGAEVSILIRVYFAKYFLYDRRQNVWEVGKRLP